MDLDPNLAVEAPVQVSLAPDSSAINLDLNPVVSASSSIEAISHGPATPVLATRSGGATPALLGAPGSAAPLCAQNQGQGQGAQGAPGAQGAGVPLSAPLAPGSPAPIPPRAHHAL